MKTKALIVLLSISSFLNAQPYSPPAGQAGSIAIYKDSSIFVNWVSGCKVIRGLQDIATPALGYASVGDSSMVIGKALENGVVSLGDGGSAICTFPYPITNGSGYDFAVFENGFDDYFLELALVEVSSDGVNFFPFPSHSLTDTVIQTGTFDSTDATRINNLAGKFRAGYGTPFDLQELVTQPGLNINAITHVKVLDVVGTLDPSYTSRDSYNNKINDPWPTAFPSGGFDLDAIGVIHENKLVSVDELSLESNWLFYPNPVKVNTALSIVTQEQLEKVSLLDLSGRVISDSKETSLIIPLISEGLYYLKIESSSSSFYKKIVVQSQN